ncbi:MAG: hypothetical protein H6739_27875 [Alphaproteobacteria bacterium]|nr:hypothetical protein [Alphaproteobacteria bacterium]
MTAESARALTAFAQGDAERYRLASASAEQALRCLEEPVAPRAAAAFHQLEAVNAYVAGEEGRSRGALRASLTLDPDRTLPEDLAPPGSDLRLWFDEAGAITEQPPQQPLPPLNGHTLYVDGRAAMSRPDDRPAVLQLEQADGVWAWNAWVPSDQTVPPIPGPIQPPAPKERRVGPLVLGLSGGAVAVATGVLWGASYRAQKDFDQLTAEIDAGSPDPARLPQLRALNNRTNALGWGARATGLGAAALVTTSIVVGVAF